MFKKILVANRGEIACRIIRTARKLGVQSVAIYSDVDRHSKFVTMADEAHHVGGNLSSESYLNRNKILQVAVDSKCQGLHPGFGFLSQNASFAGDCDNAGVTFIGPPASAITAMGSKSESKKIMSAAGVLVVPGYHQDEQDPVHLHVQAELIGYPVLIKAVSGGGGKGMRIVRSHHQFQQALDSCKRQSKKAFDDDRVIIQKYIPRPRHIQIQIFGDKFGNYVHLYERDCSIQRRHQKVVEQAPSNISEQIRKEICRSAVQAARAVGYYNAGTVEFIFDLDSSQHYFMEMNTRLQVEHPISQMITGLDFVEWQLKVASGFPLPKKQHEIEKKGHALEVRVYAEDPFNSFLPCSGRLKYFKEPTAQGGVRIETGVRQHDTISTFYDPMIAKLITYAPNRDQAIDSMNRALSNYRVVGLNNNLKFLKRLVGSEDFREGTFDTGFIEQRISTLLKKDSQPDYFQLVTAAIVRTHTKNLASLPSQLLNFKNVKGQKQKHIISVCETSIEGQFTKTCQIQYSSANKGTFFLEGQQYAFEFMPVADNAIRVTVNGRSEQKEFFVDRNTIYLFDRAGNSTGFHFVSDDLKREERIEGMDLALKSPMPGIITKIYQKAGDTVKKGQSIFAMEAMKMELIIRAEIDCKIASINVVEGEFVDSGKIIVQLEK